MDSVRSTESLRIEAEERSASDSASRIGEGRQTAPRRYAKFTSELVAWKDHLRTIPDLMRASFEQFGSQPAMGTRHTVKTVEKKVTVKVDGKDATRKHEIPWQTDYQWRTFTQLGKEISSFGGGAGGWHPDVTQIR
jgi:hypothetical protein